MLALSIVMTFLASLAAIGAYLFFWKRGQFEDMEDVKYQMFRKEED